MDCTIVRVEAGSTIQLLGRVSSDVAAHIHYCLTIGGTGRAGDATLAEIGDVDLTANVPAEFGHTRLPLRTGAAVQARLIVTWDRGSIECDLIPPTQPDARHPTTGRTRPRAAAPGKPGRIRR